MLSENARKDLKKIGRIKLSEKQLFRFLTPSNHSKAIHARLVANSSRQRCRCTKLRQGGGVTESLTKTTPYNTTFFAYAPTQISAHGTNDTFAALLENGPIPLKGKTAYIQQQNTTTGAWKTVALATTETTTLLFRGDTKICHHRSNVGQCTASCQPKAARK